MRKPQDEKIHVIADALEERCQRRHRQRGVNKDIERLQRREIALQIIKGACVWHLVKRESLGGMRRRLERTRDGQLQRLDRA